MAVKGKGPKRSKEKRITRYEYPEAVDPRTPETGHTPALEAEKTVTLPMDGSLPRGLKVGHLPSDERSLFVVDLDPAVDPVLMWAGKRNRREIPVLPLQRNEIVSDSRIVRIVEKARSNAKPESSTYQPSLFASLERQLREEDRSKRVEFYIHDEDWKNKLICGDSLLVGESLLHYEGLRGRVQMIYVDPPYSIDYNSNFQQRVDTAKNEPNDRADDVLTIKAFWDTWALGIHSYLSYMQERLYICRELLADSGSVFVQINDQNMHMMRALLDEVFGAENHFATIVFSKTTGFTDKRLSGVYDVLLWYAKDIKQVKYRQIYQRKPIGAESAGVYNRVELPDGTRRRLTSQELEKIGELPPDWRVFRYSDMSAQGAAKEPQPYKYRGDVYHPSPNSHWKTSQEGIDRLIEKGRIEVSGKSLAYVRYYNDFPFSPISNIWLDTGTGSFTDPKVYAVQTGSKVVQRCIAIATDPGDLVFDPTCGSGTTAVAAERLGRRWITCDTSRVAINIARQRLLSVVFDHYRTRNGNPSSGFIFDSAERVTLKSLAYDLEPERVELVDQPEPDKDALRVAGPFEVMTLGRYSIEDWRGQLVGAEQQGMENYVTAICRLYKKEAVFLDSSGLLHGFVESEGLGISIGPISGRVSGKQMDEAVNEAKEAGLASLHVLGWAFEANVGELKDGLEAKHGIEVQLIVVRPDSLAEGLKVTQPELLFSPLALPDIDVTPTMDRFSVALRGIAVFERKRRITQYFSPDSGYIAAWYLDEDYDGDCFVDCQMFFDFKKKPSLERALGLDIDSDAWKLRFESDPFTPGTQKRIAVKVVDVYGNESTVVRDLV